MGLLTNLWVRKVGKVGKGENRKKNARGVEV